jgi:predicted dehydrogenase
VKLTPPGRIGIIGLGDFGLFCMEAFDASADLQVVAVADPRPDLSARVPATDRVSVYENWQRLIQDTSVEVVHIATPSWTHAEIALAAAAHGKSVFVEKPLALSLADADAMTAAFEGARLALGINYVMRHQPIYRLLIALSQRGLLGSIHRIALENGAQAVPGGHWFWDRDKSGGILVEHGVHFFDVFRQIAGDARPSVTFDGGSQISTQVRYDQGAWGSFYHDFSLDKRVERLDATLLFDTGAAHLTGWIPEALRLRAITRDIDGWKEVVSASPGARLWSKDAEVITISYAVPDRTTAYSDAIVAGARQVVATHRDPTLDMDVTADDARASLALALEAQQLARR